MSRMQNEQLTIADILRGLGDTGSATTDSDTERLRETLHTQGRQYGDLLSLLESLNSSASAQDTHSQAVLNSIQHQLHNLATTHADLAQLKTRLGSDIAHTSPELQIELTRQEGQLRGCLERIAQLENQFTQRRKRLQPELDETARRRSMQTAYQQSLKTG